jgi:hypothetical protein
MTREPSAAHHAAAEALFGHVARGSNLIDLHAEATTIAQHLPYDLSETERVVDWHLVARDIAAQLGAAIGGDGSLLLRDYAADHTHPAPPVERVMIEPDAHITVLDLLEKALKDNAALRAECERLEKSENDLLDERVDLRAENKALRARLSDDD